MIFLPIVDRELRVTARQASTYWLRFFVGLAAMAVFLLLAAAGLGTTTAKLAASLFSVMSWMALIFCAFAGAFMTADTLSEEKREGTLGLLFLTDLRSHDVVLGKLAASSVQMCYAVLALFPVLALPLLMGGVSPGEFWRTVLVLLVTLFFSLGAGMLASALNRENLPATILAVLLVILATGLLPGLAMVINLVSGTHHDLRFLNWPSAAYALIRTRDNYFNWKAGHLDYWGALASMAGIGLVFLAAAVGILPRSWRENARTKSRATRLRFLARWRFGATGRRAARRHDALSVNPYYWLAVRDRFPRILLWVVLAGASLSYLAGVLLFYSHANPGGVFGSFRLIQAIWIAMIATYASAILLKFVIALEASRRLWSDRAAGGLELLLVTPLTVKEILAGQRRALLAHFIKPMLVCVAMYLGLNWLFYYSGPMKTSGISSDKSFGFMVMGNLLCLYLDFAAIGWTAMWLGLRSRRHNRAVAGSLLRVLVLPWILLVLLVFYADSHHGVISESGVFFWWFVFCAAGDMIWIMVARNGLRRSFRDIVSGGGGNSRKKPEAALVPR